MNISSGPVPPVSKKKKKKKRRKTTPATPATPAIRQTKANSTSKRKVAAIRAKLDAKRIVNPIFADMALAEEDTYWQDLFIQFAHGKQLTNQRLQYMNNELQYRRKVQFSKVRQITRDACSVCHRQDVHPHKSRDSLQQDGQVF